MKAENFNAVSQIISRAEQYGFHMYIDCLMVNFND